MIYEPPDTVSIRGDLIAGIVNLRRPPDACVQVAPGPHEYVLRDGPTMQAAITAAEARGREQGLIAAANAARQRGWPESMIQEWHAGLLVSADGGDA